MTRAVDVVRRIAPRARPTYVAAFERGDALLIAHGVTTPARLTHFLAQVLHESGALEIDWENMSYTSGRLLQIQRRTSAPCGDNWRGRWTPIWKSDARKPPPERARPTLPMNALSRAACESRNASRTSAGFADVGSSGDGVPLCWSW